MSQLISKHGSDDDWLMGGDVNAELSSSEFDALTEAGLAAMSAEDEAAISYLKNSNLLIGTIFLSPCLSERTVYETSSYTRTTRPALTLSAPSRTIVR